jgi:outer membrane receptor for ferrienterochelin and colicins
MKKTERRVQTETLQGGSAQGVDLDESFVTEVSRAAIYLRDEWRPSQQVSAHLGARAEYLTLKADYTPSELVRSFPQFAPSAQLAWRPLAQHSFRFGVGRTFKIPGTRELSPRRFIVTDNTPSNPDTRGNRYLEPESALGVRADSGRVHLLNDNIRTKDLQCYPPNSWARGGSVRFGSS